MTGSCHHVRRRFPALLRAISAAGCIAVLIAFCMGTAGCGFHEQSQAELLPSEIEELAAHRPPRDELKESQQRGSTVYEHYCAICHGEEGDGNGFNSTNLAHPPRNFTDPVFWQQTNDERVFRAVSAGGEAVEKSVLMPAWGNTLNERQLHDVVAFLPTFAGPRLNESEAE